MSSHQNVVLLSYDENSKYFTMSSGIRDDDPFGVVTVYVYGNHRNIIGFHYDDGVEFDLLNDQSYKLSPDNIASLKHINVICDGV